MTWLLVFLVHATTCPGKCVDYPAVQLQMPSKEVCVQIKQANPDVQGLDCWGKPQ